MKLDNSECKTSGYVSNDTNFQIQTHVAEWIRHQTSDLGIAGSSPVMGENLIFCDAFSE